MESSTQALASYGEIAATIVLAGALIDWMLNDAQRRRVADGAARVRAWAGAARRRSVVGQFDCPGVRQFFLASVLVAETLLFWYLGHRMGYRGQATAAGDVTLHDLVLFVAPLAMTATVLVAAGPRLIAFLTGSESLLACAAKCLAAALAADLAGYGALRAMDATLAVFGPRALIEWWDVRLWIYAAEYAASGIVVSAIAIAHLLFAICAARLLASLALRLALLQSEVLVRVIRRYPKQPLLGSVTALAGLAVIIKDWA